MFRQAGRATAPQKERLPTVTGVIDQGSAGRRQAQEVVAGFGPRALPLLLFAGAAGLAFLSWLQPGLFLRTLMPLLFLLPLAGVALMQPPLAAIGVVLLVALGPTTLLPVGASQATALTKVAGIAVAGLCALRYGLSRQFNGPGLGFLAATALTAALGTPLPGVTLGENVRSLIGGIAPFAFISARYDRRAYRLLTLAVMAGPLASVVVSVLLAPLGVGNGPIGNGRLDGMVHPANLASLSVTAITAATLELVRGDRRAILWLGINTLILFGSGARVPLLLAMLFGLGVLLTSRTAHFRFGQKLRLTALALPVALAGAAVFGQRIIERSFTDHSGRAGFQASGRDIIWELFIAAISRSPWFGQGVGAGRFAVSIEEVELLGTNAAHNEYLRLAVDFGVIGVILIFVGFVVWIARETRRMPPGEAVVMRAAGMVLALHSITDNTLIALTAMVRIFWFAVVFDRARNERTQNGRTQNGRTMRVSRSSGRWQGAAGTA
jgi:O-antigen ligase